MYTSTSHIYTIYVLQVAALLPGLFLLWFTVRHHHILQRWLQVAR